MTSPDSNADMTSSKYNMQIGAGKDIVNGDNPQMDLTVVEATYRQKVKEAYNWLNLSGFASRILPLTNVLLEDVFVRLTLTVVKEVREPLPAEKSSQAKQRESRQPERVTVQEPVELGQALSNHLLIVGEPGAGKSTLLRWLAVTFAQGIQRKPNRVGPSADADRLPVLVELGRLPDRYVKPEGGETPYWIQYLPEYLKTQIAFANTPSQLLERALADGRCLLLFDGLDEVADRQARMRLASSLAELARLSPGNRVIIGSRPAGVSESEGALRPPQFQRCKIERFTPEDVQRFFHFWYALDHDLTHEQQLEAADALYARVQATPAILQLATTPLLTTILVLIWRSNERNLPGRRVELYERCCRTLIEDWENNHHVSYQGILSKIGWERHLRLLAPLAYTIHSQEQRTSASSTELIPLLARSLQAEGLCSNESAALLEAEQFLSTLGLRSGLLQYMGDDRYGFPHLTFQEYLAARYIAAQPFPEYTDLVMKHLNKAWWQEVHLLTIGHLGSGNVGASKASALTLTTLHVYKPPSWILRSSRKFWLRLIAPGKFLPKVQLERRIAWILAREFELAVKGYAECVPNGMMTRVGTVLSAQAGSLVRHIIYDEARRDHQEALLTIICQSLHHQGNEAVVSALLEALHDADRAVRERATESLGHVGVGNEAVVSALLETLHDADWNVRQQAAMSLGHVGVGNEAVASALLEANMYEEATASLRLIGAVNEAVASALVRAALRDKDWSVQRRAEKVLGQMGAVNEVVVSALLESLHDADPGVRQQAAWVLGQVGIGNEAVASALLEAVHDTDEAVRRRAAVSLGQVGVGNEAVMSALLKALHDADPDARFQAATILSKVGVGSEAAVNALALTVLHDANEAVRSMAAVSLIPMGADNKAVVSVFALEALHDADRDVRRRAAVILGQMGVGNEAAVSVLLEALHDADENVRQQAAATLGSMGAGNEAVASALLDALHDANPGVQVLAAASLEQLGAGNEAVVSVLLEALHNADRDVRRRAAASLRLIRAGNEAVVSALLEALHDPDWFVQRQAVDALGQMGSGNEAVASVLLEALHDADENVRQQAAEILGQMGSGNETVASVLLEALHDENVRQQAAEALGKMGVGNEAVASALALAVLHDADEYVRRRVAEILKQVGVGNEAVASVLLEALHDADEYVRWQAAEILGQVGVGNEAVASALLEALHDADWIVRRMAAEALDKVGVGNEAVASALALEALHNTDKNVHQQAVEILGKVGAGNEAVASALLAALHDANPGVRRRAAEILGQVGVDNEAVASALLEALHDADEYVRRQAATSLGRLEIKDMTQLRQVLVALNRCLHYYFFNEMRWVALRSIVQLLDGRPIPGYRWAPLQKRQARLRLLRRIAILAGIVAFFLLVALTVSLLDPNSLIARLVASLSLLATIVSITGVTMRDIWKRKESSRVQVSNRD